MEGDFPQNTSTCGCHWQWHGNLVVSVAGLALFLGVCTFFSVGNLAGHVGSVRKAYFCVQNAYFCVRDGRVRGVRGRPGPFFKTRTFFWFFYIFLVSPGIRTKRMMVNPITPFMIYVGMPCLLDSLSSAKLGSLPRRYLGNGNPIAKMQNMDRLLLCWECVLWPVMIQHQLGIEWEVSNVLVGNCNPMQMKNRPRLVVGLGKLHFDDVWIQHQIYWGHLEAILWGAFPFKYVLRIYPKNCWNRHKLSQSAGSLRYVYKVIVEAQRSHTLHKFQLENPRYNSEGLWLQVPC